MLHHNFLGTVSNCSPINLFVLIFYVGYPIFHRKPLCPKRPEIRKEGDTVYLTVSDNGKGMNKEFDLQSDKKDHLGLQIIKVLSEGQLQGEIKVESENGFRFMLIFRCS